MNYINRTRAIVLATFIFTVNIASADDAAGGKDKFYQDEIVIKAKSVSAIEDITDTTVITGEDVTAHSDKTLDDALKNVPGLQVTMHKKGNMRAQFRGFDQNKAAILIDGIPVNDVYSTDIDISNIPVTGISEIVVNRGAVSALFGAMGGVGIINIITKKPSEPYCEAKSEYGQFNNIFLGASAGSPMGNSYISVSGEYSHSGGYDVSKKLNRSERRKWFDKLIRYDLYGLSFDDVDLPAKNDYINDTGLWNHTEHDRYSLNGKFGYNLVSYGDAGVNLNYSFKKALTNSYQFNAISNYNDDSGTWQDPVFDVSADPMEIKSAAFRNRSFVWPEIHNVNVSPFLDLDLNTVKLKANVFFTYKKAVLEKYACNDHSWPGDTVLADTALEPFRTIKEYLSWGGNMTPAIRLAYWNRLSLGLLYKYNVYNESEQAISAEKSPAIAATIFGLDPYPVKRLDVSYFTAAIEDETFIGTGVTISAGVSYDAQFFHTFKNREALYQYDDAYIVKNDSGLLGTKDSINPVAGIMLIPVKDFLILRGACSIKTRFPDLNEYSMIVDDKRDNGLKPERAYNLNTGMEFLLLDTDLSLRTDYFLSRVKNRIEKISGGIDPPVNIGEVRSQGIESMIDLKHMRIAGKVDVQCSLSYTYLHARSLDDTREEKVNRGKYLEYTPEHQICADLRMRFKSDTSVTIWGYSTINQVVYAMKKRPEPFPTVTEFSTDYFEAVKLHNPVMANIRIAQKIDFNYEIYVMCKNILDDYEADPFIPGPGRVFYTGASAEF